MHPLRIIAAALGYIAFLTITFYGLVLLHQSARGGYIAQFFDFCIALFSLS